jgi:hypothetical protein
MPESDRREGFQTFAGVGKGSHRAEVGGRR